MSPIDRISPIEPGVAETPVRDRRPRQDERQRDEQRKQPQEPKEKPRVDKGLVNTEQEQDKKNDSGQGVDRYV